MEPPLQPCLKLRKYWNVCWLFEDDTEHHKVLEYVSMGHRALEPILKHPSIFVASPLGAPTSTAWSVWKLRQMASVLIARTKEVHRSWGKKNFNVFNAPKKNEVLPPKILGVGVQPVQPYGAVLGWGIPIGINYIL